MRRLRSRHGGGALLLGGGGLPVLLLPRQQSVCGRSLAGEQGAAGGGGEASEKGLGVGAATCRIHRDGRVFVHRHYRPGAPKKRASRSRFPPRLRLRGGEVCRFHLDGGDWQIGLLPAPTSPSPPHPH